MSLPGLAVGGWERGPKLDTVTPLRPERLRRVARRAITDAVSLIVRDSVSKTEPISHNCKPKRIQSWALLKPRIKGDNSARETPRVEHEKHL